jgi:hypothetical protein
VARITDRIAGLEAEAVAGNKRLINSKYEAAGFTIIDGYRPACVPFSIPIPADTGRSVH